MLDALLLFVILAINVAISVWNCYAVGTAWRDVRALGNGFHKLLLWCGVIQSGIGFSMPILLGLAFLAKALLTGGEEPTLTMAEADQMMEWIFSLWYVAVIFPILGSGLTITIHSIKIAIERRDFSSIAAAGWNSLAQMHNIRSAWINLGPAFDSIGDLFDALSSGKGSSDSDDDGKGKVVAFLVIGIVILALVGGFLIAFGLVRYFMKGHESRIERHARDLRSRATA